MRERASRGEASGTRAQASLPAVEAAVGVVLVLAAVSTFAMGVPVPDRRHTQLDAYAGDGATVLASEPPRHRDATRLSEVVASEDAFQRERDALRRRVERILPDDLMFRLETPQGPVGFERPAGVTTGVATVPTAAGRVTIRVWYA